jgi:hypothetical protein
MRSAQREVDDPTKEVRRLSNVTYKLEVFDARPHRDTELGHEDDTRDRLASLKPTRNDPQEVLIFRDQDTVERLGSFENNRVGSCCHPVLLGCEYINAALTERPGHRTLDLRVQIERDHPRAAARRRHSSTMPACHAALFARSASTNSFAAAISRSTTAGKQL